MNRSHRPPLAAAVLVCAAVVSARAAIASAQGTVTYSWDVNESGSNTATIGPGEIISLRMWVLMEPEPTAFAGSIYDIAGLENWATGTIVRYENRLDDLTGPGDLQPNNDIWGIESFQLPPLFGECDPSNPIALYDIEWIPHDYTARTVRVSDVDHLNNDVYTDNFGSSEEYEQSPSEGAIIHIVPAPATLALVALGLAVRHTR